MNYYAFHIGDYAGATRHLSWDEDAAYRRLLDAYYVREAPIPADKRQAYRLLQASSEQQREAVDVILQEFFELRDDGWHNSRCDAEIAAVREKSLKASQSANKRWGNANKDTSAVPTHEEPDANASQTTCEGNAPNPNPNPNPNPKSQDKQPKTKTARKRAAALRHVSVDDLAEDGVDRETAADWLAIREEKNLPLTLTAWNDTKSEAVKAGLSPGDAVRRAASEGWAGFKAGWLHSHGPPLRANGSHHNRQEALEASNSAVAARWLAEHQDAA